MKLYYALPKDTADESLPELELLLLVESLVPPRTSVSLNPLLLPPKPPNPLPPKPPG